MKGKLKKHIVYYIAFGLVQLLGMTLIFLSLGNKQLLLLAILGTTLFYFTFAIVHHILDHDLTSKIVVEYALFGCLGLALSMWTLYFNT